jgi:hypothetical protein
MVDSPDDPMADRLLARANEIYAEKKRSKYPYLALEELPGAIESDQVKAVLEALSEEIEEIWLELAKVQQNYQQKKPRR